MTTPRDRPGMAMTADDIHRAQAALGDDGERTTEPESHCVPCGWADSGGRCECYDGVPRC